MQVFRALFDFLIQSLVFYLQLLKINQVQAFRKLLLFLELLLVLRQRVLQSQCI